SGYFIVATDAWMQHPVGYTLGPNGAIELSSFWALLLNAWAFWQYAHTMIGAVQTGCFVMAGVGAFYLQIGRRRGGEKGRSLCDWSSDVCSSDLALLLNAWAFWQYAHTMIGAVQTGCFVMAGVGAFYL